MICLQDIFDEGQYVEPMNYLPIIPTVLCKNNIGVAVGYAMHNQAYNPLDVIKACKQYLETGKISATISPYLRLIKKSNWRFIEDKLFNFGEWKFNQSKDLMAITDLPADTSYEDFEKLLNKSAYRVSVSNH